LAIAKNEARTAGLGLFFLRELSGGQKSCQISALPLRTTRKRKQEALFEKSAQKLLRLPAFDRPQYGHSKAGGRKSFLVTFFRKSNFFLPASSEVRFLMTGGRG
jgi:hypothetical protein